LERPCKAVKTTNEFVQLEWEPLKMGDNGKPYRVLGYRHMTFHISGIRNGKILIQGSTNKNKFDPIADREGIPLVFGTDGFKSSDDDVVEVMPKSDGVRVGEAILVSMIARK